MLSPGDKARILDNGLDPFGEMVVTIIAPHARYSQGQSYWVEFEDGRRAYINDAYFEFKKAETANR